MQTVCRNFLFTRCAFWKQFRTMSSGSPPLHDLVKPLSWLLGKWRTESGAAFYPTMEPMTYIEELEFSHVGQPNIQFSFNSWHAETKKPLHQELGFIRIDPASGRIALLVAQNLGICEVEEGTVNGEELTVESHTVGRMTFGKEPAVKKVQRKFRLNGEELEQLTSMETSTKPLQEHLKARYKKLS